MVLHFLHSKLSSPELLNEKYKHSLQMYDQFYFFLQGPMYRTKLYTSEKSEMLFSKKINVCVYTHTHSVRSLGRPPQGPAQFHNN